ncbi:MAG TPA: hypothetical protein VHA33_29255 [Candidatus Angelobacter sp.]|jgi:hypothetical protein|nr:hypothetical protein [Candidatus Angelobacter sp.]
MFVPAPNLGRVSPRGNVNRRLHGLALGKIAAAHAVRSADSRARLDVRERLRFVPLRGLGDTTCSVDPATGARVCASPAQAPPIPAPVLTNPAGSYLQTCRNIFRNGDQLSASCDSTGQGPYVTSSLPGGIAACGTYDIANISGQLRCLTPGTSISPAPSPAPLGPPSTNFINPATGQPYPLNANGQQYDPATGALINAATGVPYQAVNPFSPTGGPLPAPFVNTAPAVAAPAGSTSMFSNPYVKWGAIVAAGLGGFILIKKAFKR